jgi:hypothetical protein
MSTLTFVRALCVLRKDVRFIWKILRIKRHRRSSLCLTALTMEIRRMKRSTETFVIHWLKVFWKDTTVQYLHMDKQVIFKNILSIQKPFLVK